MADDHDTKRSREFIQELTDEQFRSHVNRFSSCNMVSLPDWAYTMEGVLPGRPKAERQRAIDNTLKSCLVNKRPVFNDFPKDGFLISFDDLQEGSVASCGPFLPAKQVWADESPCLVTQLPECGLCVTKVHDLQSTVVRENWSAAELQKRLDCRVGL